MRTSECLVLWVVLSCTGQACGAKSERASAGTGGSANASGARGSGAGGKLDLADCSFPGGQDGGGATTEGASGEAGTEVGGGGGTSRGVGGGGGRNQGGSGAGQGGGGLVCSAGKGGSSSSADIVCSPQENPTGCDALDCVSDCTNPKVVRGKADGCGVRCPSDAPIPLIQCAQACGASHAAVICGPGLYCTLHNYTYGGYTKACVDDDVFCGCERVPDGCPPSGPADWVCGIDGNAYPSLCEAHRARTDILAWQYETVCPPPSADLYQCGGIFCQTGEPCVIQSGPDDNDPDRYSCSPVGGAGGEGS